LLVSFFPTCHGWHRLIPDLQLATLEGVLSAATSDVNYIAPVIAFTIEIGLHTQLGVRFVALVSLQPTIRTALPSRHTEYRHLLSATDQRLLTHDIGKDRRSLFLAASVPITALDFYTPRYTTG
jgi:hypothetical protein